MVWEASLIVFLYDPRSSAARRTATVKATYMDAAEKADAPACNRRPQADWRCRINNDYYSQKGGKVASWLK